ncbi:MAG: type IX secretion system membrane protein PorP/SprF [Bacteroidota bacterium]
MHKQLLLICKYDQHRFTKFLKFCKSFLATIAVYKHNAVRLSKHKYLLFSLFFFACTFSSFAQQDEQYTQFMFNKLRYNAAYAGSNGSPSVTAIHRSQWIGLEGAPTSQVVSFDMPLLKNRIGVGGNVVRNVIGVSEAITIDGSYAYRIPLGPGIMGLGLQASLRYFNTDFTDLTATQPIGSDNAIPMGVQSKFVPNFGLGFYYHTEEFYLGFSAPRLLRNNIDLADDEGIISREIQHFYVMGGVIIGEDDFKFLPQMLIKYNPTVPFDADINASIILLDRITIGATYRLGGSKEKGFGESIGGLFSAQVNDDLLLGISYDATLSDLRNFQDGSIELALRISFGDREDAPDKEYVNPRHF